jgi:hypothetical protein
MCDMTFFPDYLEIVARPGDCNIDLGQSPGIFCRMVSNQCTAVEISSQMIARHTDNRTMLGSSQSNPGNIISPRTISIKYPLH